MSRYDHAKYPARCLRDTLIKYMHEHNLTSTELCNKIGWKPQYFSRLSRMDWVLTSKAVYRVEKALNIQLPDPEGYDERVQADTHIALLTKIYPPDFIQFALTEVGYKTLMAAYSNCTDDAKLREDQRAFLIGLDKLHQYGLPQSTKNVNSDYMNEISKKPRNDINI